MAGKINRSHNEHARCILIKSLLIFFLFCVTVSLFLFYTVCVVVLHMLVACVNDAYRVFLKIKSHESL